MKKLHSRWGGVAKCENRTPTLGGNHKKKRLPCSMGVQNMVFATPLARERRFRQTQNDYKSFVVVDFGKCKSV